MSMVVRLAMAGLIVSIFLVGCDCGGGVTVTPRDGGDTDSSVINPGDSGVDSGNAGQDSGVDAAPGTDAAPGVDTAPVTDAAPDTDAAPGEDAAPGTDAAPGVDTAPGPDAGPGPDAVGADVAQTDAGEEDAAQSDAWVEDTAQSDAWVEDVVVGNQPPVVTITQPEDGFYVHPGDDIDFRGRADDPEDGRIRDGLVWESDVEGEFATGGRPSEPLTTLGDHTITLSATDSDGATGSASITVHVVDNIPPRCVIDRPQDDSDHMFDDDIRFQGSCYDPEDDSDVDAAELTWTSDLDDEIGSATDDFQAVLSVGVHEITLCGTDPDDASLEGCTAITVTVHANTVPICGITAPTEGAPVGIGAPVAFEATATDTEDPDITGDDLQIAWSLDEGAPFAEDQLTAELTFDDGDLGNHDVTITVTDSYDEVCTETVTFTVAVPPTASIDSVTQGGSADQPFFSDAAIDLEGTGSDPGGGDVTLSWSDSLAGEFGEGASVSLSDPLVGKHTVVLTVTNTAGLATTATEPFTVLAPGETELAPEVTDVSDAMDDIGDSNRVRALHASSDGMVYVSNDSSALFVFDGTDAAATATTLHADGDLPDDARDIYLDETGGLFYLATQSGLVVCDWDAVTGVDVDSCDTFDPSGEDEFNAVVRLTGSDSGDRLLVGGPIGLVEVDDTAGSNDGDIVLEVEVRAMVVDGDAVWIATNNDGLVRFDPVSGEALYFDQGTGAPADSIRAVAVDSAGQVWVGTDNGLGLFDPVAESWTVWQQGEGPAPGLDSANIRAVAVHNVEIGGIARDVIWIGTEQGVTRFDPSVPSMMNLTEADGLPGTPVFDIAVLSDGTKIFGTDSGVARYVGF